MTNIIDLLWGRTEPNLISVRPTDEGVTKLIKAGGICKALTFTFKPEFHAKNQKKLYRYAKSKIIECFHKTRKLYYVEAWSEFTTSLVLHFHLFCVGETAYTLSKMTSMWRKCFGFIYVSKLNDIYKWREYCQKDKGKAFKVIRIGNV